MKSTIPAEVLALKTRLDQWRTTRNHIRERMPADLRRAVVELGLRHSPTLIRRVLKIDPWRLNGSMTTIIVPTRNKQEAPFFEIPTDAVLPAPISITANPPNFRLHLERPDGSPLTLNRPGIRRDYTFGATGISGAIGSVWKRSIGSSNGASPGTLDSIIAETICENFVALSISSLGKQSTASAT